MTTHNLGRTKVAELDYVGGAYVVGAYVVGEACQDKERQVKGRVKEGYHDDQDVLG